jgi:hypothetical protein
LDPYDTLLKQEIGMTYPMDTTMKHMVVSFSDLNRALTFYPDPHGFEVEWSPDVVGIRDAGTYVEPIGISKPARLSGEFENRR